MPIYFETYGPFNLDRNGHKLVKESLSGFWSDVDQEHPGLSKAIGIYIFAIKAKKKSAPKPWYVGKTEAQGFQKRFKQHIRHFEDALEKAKYGTPQLLLIAKRTPTGKAFRKVNKARTLTSIDHLESLLIGSCLDKNSDLINISKTAFLKNMHVPGYLNNRRGSSGSSASELRHLTGRK